MADSSTEMEQRIGRLLLLKNTKPTSTIMSKITTALRAAGTLAIGGLAFSQEKAAPNISKEIAENNSASISKKLKTIIIPMIDFEDTTLDEAIDFLRARSRELDNETKDPQQKGINFVVRRPRNGNQPLADQNEPRIDSLFLKNVPLEVAIQYICDKAKLRYKVDQFAVTILPLATEAEEQEILTVSFKLPKTFDPTDKELHITNKDWLIKQGVRMPKGAKIAYQEGSQTLLVKNSGSNLELIQAIVQSLHEKYGKSAAKIKTLEQKFRNIRIPLIDFEEATLGEAVDFLGFRAKELEAPEFSFLIKGKPDPRSKKIDALFLKNVPLHVALQYICDKTQTRYSLHEKTRWIGGIEVKNAVVISPLPPQFEED